MKIDAIELHEIRMRLRAPFETSFGREDTKTCLLVRVEADGLEGWGEAPVGSAPLYNEETADTAWSVLEHFIIPPLLDRPLPTPRAFAQQVAHIRRHHMAKAGLEAALWDIEAQRQRLPLAAVLGGERDRIQVGVSIGIEPTVDEVVARAEAFLTQGYRRIKVKIKPGFDIELARRIRERFGNILLQVDANSAYSLADVPTFKAMDDYDLLLIEQPLEEDDIVDHAKLQAQLRTPICLDESIIHERAARVALELGACRVINVKQARVGGLGAAVAIHDLCRAHDVPVWCGGMLETGIGRAANIALCSLPNFRLPADLSASDRYFEEDLIDPPVVLNSDGTITVPTGVGLGVRVVPERIRRHTVRRARFTR
ncbi:MAG: o-succinylbenzoate synthase [bacterium]